MPIVCIEVKLDTDTGKITVEKCEPKEEMAEGEGMPTQPEMGGMPMEQMMGEMESEGAEQEFTDIDQALRAAKAILTGGGEQTQSPEQEQQSMEKGYAKAGNVGMRKGMM